MTEDTQIYNGEKTVSSVCSAGKMDSYVWKNEIRTFLQNIYKIYLKCIKGLNIRPETMKLLAKTSFKNKRKIKIFLDK